MSIIAPTDGVWHRVNRERVCPICKRSDWCLFAGDPGDPVVVICARVESQKRCGEAGWLHRLRDDPDERHRRRVRTIQIPTASPPVRDWARLLIGYQNMLRPPFLRSLAEELGLTTTSLRRLGIGWCWGHEAFGFPMRDAAGNVVGIRLRYLSGQKAAIRGSREGLFLPDGLTFTEPLLITEGPTDCAALLDLRFETVARPSCTGGVKLLVELVKEQKIKNTVIVADADVYGRRGAARLVTALIAYVSTVRVVVPPAGVKDARAWKRAGASQSDVQAAIDAAPIQQLKVEVRQHGR